MVSACQPTESPSCSSISAASSSTCRSHSGADPRDGLFQVAVLRTRNVAGLLPAIIAGLSGAQKMPGIDVYQASRVTIDAEPRLRMQYDGEVIDDFTPFEARILPRAAKFLLPSDSPYAD